MHNENGNQAGSDEDLALEENPALEDGLPLEEDLSLEEALPLEEDLSLETLEPDGETDGFSIALESPGSQAADAPPSAGDAPSVVEKFVIRLPSGLRDQIKQLSEQNRRSMNAEIILVLENHIRQQLLEQMAQTHEADDAEAALDSKEAALKSVLEKLPVQKQLALLELLRN